MRLSTIRRPPAPPAPLEIGSYFCSPSELYCVEDVIGDVAVIEDCSSGELLRVLASDVRLLAPVRR